MVRNNECKYGKHFDDCENDDCVCPCHDDIPETQIGAY